MAKKRQAVKCVARRRNGSPCEAYAINGGTVCGAHGGRAPQVRGRARESLVEDRVERLLYRYDAEPCDNPLEALRLLAGRALAVEQAIGEMVNRLTSIRYESMAGGEQLRSEVAVLERSMDRAGKVLVDIAKLNIDERLTRISEAQSDLIEKALRAGMAEAGLDLDAQDRAARAVGRHLRAA